MGRITIKEVAEEASVAISTVSLVLNEKGYVSAKTRNRVRAAAERLGYIPTRAARDLASQKTGNIGFILREDHFTRSEPFYTRVFLGTEFGARHHAVYVLLATVPRAYDPLVHAPRFLRERSVDGVIIAGKVSDLVLADVERLRVPLVLVDFEHGTHPSVVIDNRGGARAAVAHLIEQGRKKVAFVGADMTHPSLSERLDGYTSTMREAGLGFDESLVITTDVLDPSRETGARLAERLLALPERPDAAFCVNDALALGLMDRLVAEGVRIPEDVAVVGFDDVAGASSAPVALSSVRVFTEQLGELGLRTLMEESGNAMAVKPSYSRANHRIHVPTELVVRSSSRLKTEQ
jgi:LacI family transcriptional regulator